MMYENIRKAVFLSRPNRFIANIELDGKPEICHVKNTGRCHELLVPGAEIYVQANSNQNRKTAFDLITVRKGDRLINMDAAAPNRVFPEWAYASGYFGEITLLRPETRYHNSRFDFLLESANRSCFIEVKGVTLEDNGVARFPDAPTERGVKHLHELIRARAEGFGAFIVFVIQMENILYFEPNRATHPAFADALIEAVNMGVEPIAFLCRVTENSLTPLLSEKQVEIRLL